MEPTLSRKQLLAEWEAVHGRMSRKLQDKFLARQELRELAFYPEGIVKTAIQSHPRLRKILVEARRMKPSIKFAVEKMMTGKHNDPNLHPGPLPLPGDPGATRTPGRKRERYRTGEEAELRNIARKHRWWD